MASNDLGFNDAKLAWGNWDYVDLSHFTGKMPGTSLTASALSIVKGCGAKAQHPGVLAGVASFSAGIALHRMRRSHGKRSSAHVNTVGPLPAHDICQDRKDERSWLPVLIKGAGGACLLFAASRKVRKRWKTALAAKSIKLDRHVKPAIQLDDTAVRAPNFAGDKLQIQDSIQSLSTKAPSTATLPSSLGSSSSGRGRRPDRSSRPRQVIRSHTSKILQVFVFAVIS